jgi:hypothetical protein
VFDELFDVFFIIYSTYLELTINKKAEKSLSEKESNKIASLGEINKLQKQQSLKKQDSALGLQLPNSHYAKLWNHHICSESGKTLLNSAIKTKLTGLTKKSKDKNMSLYDIPMIKIVLSTHHLLDFENKRTLFRAELKRIKRQKRYNNIYLSFDRKEVFQQSFTEIMNRKPDTLKGKLKI